VLDIHHDRITAFDREDIAVLQALANQIGVALQNAKLYCQLEQANAKLEEMSITDPLTGIEKSPIFIDVYS
jgi:GAF domain-containing protein